MPLSQAARIARLKAEEEKTRAARQASAVPARDPHHPDPPGAGLPKVAAHAPQESRADRPRDVAAGPVAARRAVDPDHRPGPEPAPRGPLPDPNRHQPGRAVDPARNPKAEAAVERFKEKLDQRQKERTPEPETVPEDDPVAQADVEAASERRDEIRRDPETGRFLEGHAKVGGRVGGTPNVFPRDARRAMKELIAGRLRKIMKDEEGKEVPRSAAEIMVDLIFDGMQGKLILRADNKGITYANPLHALKLFHDYMLKSRELAIKRADAKKKAKGTGGGIRIVLPSVPADPLLKPGQQPRPLRLLGQDPSTPLPDATGTATTALPSPGPVPTHADGARKPANTRSTPPAITAPYQRLNQQPSPAPAPNSEGAFDRAELIEDFEHPICQFCMGIEHVRDENGIHMVTCDFCEGEGRAPAPE